MRPPVRLLSTSHAVILLITMALSLARVYPPAAIRSLQQEQHFCLLIPSTKLSTKAIYNIYFVTY